ncbi:MAG: LamG-like jellyroll fold domain-containing protein [Bacteroidales bacterium]
MKKRLLSALLFTSYFIGFAQTTNYALNLSGSSAVQVNKFSALNNLSEFTFQSSVYIDEWVSNSTLFSQKSGNQSISMTFGNTIEEGLIFSISNDDKTWSQVLRGIALHQWQNLTLTFDSYSDDKVCFYIDGELQKITVSDINFPFSLAHFDSPLLVGENMRGRLDEVRIWGKALMPEELYWNTTVSRFHPQYDSLELYWKFDQNQCDNIVDYKDSYHAQLYPLTRSEVKDNENLKYRIASGYTSFPRMIDRSNIDKEMYHMTNDLIILSAKVLPDGRIYMDYPDNSGSLVNTEFLSEFNGRNGILSFKGNGAKMNVGTETFMESPVRATPVATFQGWFFIDNWIEGSYLVRKTDNNGQEISIRLGSEADKSLIVAINQYEFISKNKIEIGAWQHIAVKLNASSSRFNRKVRFQYNAGAESYADVAPSSGSLSTVPLMDTSETYVGENFSGKMDEVMIWRSDRSESNTKLDATKGYSYPTGEWSDILLCSYWKGDSAENPGLDSQSWVEMEKYMRSMYSNNRGFKVRYGLISAEGDQWKSMIADQNKLNTFIEELKILVPQTDGIDIDFEWCYTQAEWNNYGNMVEKIRSVVPASKVFSCSLHAVSYKLEKRWIDMVDYFTFQIYGPSPDIWAYDRYVKAYNDFIAHGFPKEKILMSIGTLATNSQKAVVGYKDVIEANPGISFDKDEVVYNGSLYTFNGVSTVQKKMQFIVDNKIGGSMYFDMGNDMKVSNEYSLIRAMNEIVPSNVDTLITNVEIETSTITTPDDAMSVHLYPNPSTGVFKVRLPSDDQADCTILNLNGSTIGEYKVSNSQEINLTHLPKGCYLISVTQNQKKYNDKIYIK